MGFSLSSITNKVTSSLKGGVRAIDKVDPTGISSTMLTGGLNIASGAGGGMVSGAVNKALGKGGGGGSAAPQGRKRYQRKERNQWKSKRQLKFEAGKKKKAGKRMKKMAGGFANAAKMLASGVKK